MTRASAFKRFIAEADRRGGEAIPNFPLGAQWFNAPPLRLDRHASLGLTPMMLPM